MNAINDICVNSYHKLDPIRLKDRGSCWTSTNLGKFPRLKKKSPENFSKSRLIQYGSSPTVSDPSHSLLPTLLPSLINPSDQTDSRILGRGPHIWFYHLRSWRVATWFSGTSGHSQGLVSFFFFFFFQRWCVLFWERVEGTKAALLCWSALFGVRACRPPRWPFPYSSDLCRPYTVSETLIISLKNIPRSNFRCSTRSFNESAPEH